MRPEALNERVAPQTAPLFNCPTALRLSRNSIQTAPISVMARTFDPATLTALDAVEPGHLPRLRLVGKIEHLRKALDRGLAEIAFGPKWLANWLSDDVIFLARLFQELTKTQRLRLRLEAVEDDACRRFHTDKVSFRLVTTYRGPGTEWIPSSVVAAFPPGAALLTESICHLDRGDVAIIRGSRGATSDRPGLLHRSPPIAGTGITRLFLAVDDGADLEA